MTQVYPHEAWCPRCSVSHPPGTRTCLHCGGPVMPVRLVEEGQRGAAPPPPGPLEIPTRPEIVAPDDDDGGNAADRIARPLRIGIAGIWLVLAIVGALLRACSERG